MPNPGLSRIVSGALAGVVFLGFVAWFAVRHLLPEAVVDDLRREVGLERGIPERHLIPRGYVGWLTTGFRIEGTPQLDTEDGCLVFTYPASGHLETSSPPNRGLRGIEYFFTTGDTLLPIASVPGVSVWGEVTVSSTSEGDDEGLVHSFTSAFFVGTREQYEEAKHPLGLPPIPDLPPLPGPPSGATTE